MKTTMPNNTSGILAFIGTPHFQTPWVSKQKNLWSILGSANLKIEKLIPREVKPLISFQEGTLEHYCALPPWWNDRRGTE